MYKATTIDQFDQEARKQSECVGQERSDGLFSPQVYLVDSRGTCRLLDLSGEVFPTAEQAERFGGQVIETLRACSPMRIPRQMLPFEHQGEMGIIVPSAPGDIPGGPRWGLLWKGSERLTNVEESILDVRPADQKALVTRVKHWIDGGMRLDLR